MRRSARITVAGLVQGIGYRYFCRRQAGERHLVGWVKNLPGGSVSLYVEGEAEELERFIAELRRGPAGAKVTTVDADYGDYSGKFNTFDVTF
jgi:acylphosphatase